MDIAMASIGTVPTRLGVMAYIVLPAGVLVGLCLLEGWQTSIVWCLSIDMHVDMCREHVYRHVHRYMRRYARRPVQEVCEATCAAGKHVCVDMCICAGKVAQTSIFCALR